MGIKCIKLRQPRLKLTKFKVKYEQVFRVVYILFCAAMCLYQIVTICQIYFSYKTTTFVKYENISKISLPAITICVEKREVITNEAKERYNLSEATDEILAKLTVKDQFKLMMKYQDIFESCSVMTTVVFKSNSLHYMPCDEITRVVASIDYTRSKKLLFFSRLNKSILLFIIFLQKIIL